MAFALDLNQTYEQLKPLIIFIFAMSIYSIFIFKFYRFLAKKDILKLGLDTYNTGNHWFIKSFFSIILYFLEYIIFLPLCIFFWFAILSVLLTFLAKSQSLSNIFLVSMAVVGTVRIMAYYNGNLARDLAKMLPFALLGVFLVDITYFNLYQSIQLIYDLRYLIGTLINYLAFIICLEFILRIIYIFRGSPGQDEED
ncbi:MAG: hypothetical protein KC589_11520 [Nanoarchaeota archaeon]|nr:hypothetical protein [Nanoarchaeota archaeon]